MVASESKGGSSFGDKIVDDPMSDTHLSIGYCLESGIMNSDGQLMGEYSRLDYDLWLPDPEEEEDAGLNCHFESHEKIVDLLQPSEFVDNAVCDGSMVSQYDSLDLLINRNTALISEKVASWKDSSQKQSQMSSQIAVFQTKRSYSDVTTMMYSQSKCHQPTKNNFSGSIQISGTTSSSREQSWVFQSESDYSMESSLSDETEESIPSKPVRTRKVSDILDLDSGRAVKKCMHCETEETPQWRTGPLGRRTLCNACGVQYRHGRLFPDYRPLKSPTFNPSLHFNLPKNVQEIIMGRKSERGSNLCRKAKAKEEMRRSITSDRGMNSTPKPKKIEAMRMSHTSVRSPNLSSEPKEMEEMRIGEVAQNFTFEPETVEEMILGDYNEKDQNHAHRAKKFQEIKDKASYVLKLDTRKRNQNFGFNNLIQKQKAKVAKKCLHCESTETPQWREGPLGRHTLCNACGVQYKAGRLFPEYRPLKSPTYDPLLHSHLPKKVLKMRLSNREKST